MVCQPRSLIINADDFGYNDAITQGILKGYREGLITSTSAMMNIDGAPERVAEAHRSEPSLPIGLHLNLTAGRPVLPHTQIPHLTDPHGSFYPFEDLLLRLADIPPEEARAELFAQARLLLETGVQFDHIDCHQQVMAMYNPFIEIVVDLARKFQVPVRQPSLAPVRGRLSSEKLSSLSEVAGFVLRTGLHHPKRMMHFLRYLDPRWRKQAAAGVGTTDWFVGAFFGDPTPGNFSAILRQLRPGTSELMTHPAIAADELYHMEEAYRSERVRELEVLLDPRARAEVKRLGIRLIDFSAVRFPDSLMEPG